MFCTKLWHVFQHYLSVTMNRKIPTVRSFAIHHWFCVSTNNVHGLLEKPVGVVYNGHVSVIVSDSEQHAHVSVTDYWRIIVCDWYFLEFFFGGPGSVRKATVRCFFFVFWFDFAFFRKRLTVYLFDPSFLLLDGHLIVRWIESTIYLLMLCWNDKIQKAGKKWISIGSKCMLKKKTNRR